MSQKSKYSKCVHKGCQSKVLGKDSFRCPKHELMYYFPVYGKRKVILDKPGTTEYDY